MELRVWVDGTQRVVCGVKLSTTCQEIVFALAHATQQAGRFTMIERWRNNERLLSPNEQPLVTLQRWGDRMNEVEFILKKTSTDTQPPRNRTPVEHAHSQNQPTTTAPTAPRANEKQSSNNGSDPSHPQTLTNGHRESPAISSAPNHNQAPLDKTSDIMFQHQRSYNLNQRPHSMLGAPLTTSSSALNLGPNPMQSPATRLLNTFRPSLSTSTLPSVTNNLTASSSDSAPMLRPRCLDDTTVGANSPTSSLNDPHNGYHLQSRSQQFQHHQIANQSRVSMPSRNYPFEDLYSSINKRRVSQLPPVVPAKPRLINPNHSQQTLQHNNNAHMNFYQANPSPMNLFPANPRPRHPPGYLEYLEAMANRNSLPSSLISNPNLIHQTQHAVSSNIFPRPLEHQQQLYSLRQNGFNPTSNQHYNQVNGKLNRNNFVQNHDFHSSNVLQSISHPINSKFAESSGLVINRGSAVNVRLPFNSQSIPPQSNISNDDNLNASTQSSNSSVTQMGRDMLRVIEEQKRVLMNQKTELDRLDNDQEYLDAKQSSEQAELIYRIESEIRQLEDLWRENQAQINKLENQDFEKELEQLKSEQVRMECEIANQKTKLSQCENDLEECNHKIEQLKAELNSQGVESDGSVIEDNVNENTDESAPLTNEKESDCDTTKPTHSILNKTTISAVNHQPFDSQEPKSSDDDGDDHSGGDASDDLNTNSYESKLRSAKEVPYLEKRGLISGIRSLKLEKLRSLNRSTDR